MTAFQLGLSADAGYMNQLNTSSAFTKAVNMFLVPGRAGSPQAGLLLCVDVKCFLGGHGKILPLWLENQLACGSEFLLQRGVFWCAVSDAGAD